MATSRPEQPRGKSASSIASPRPFRRGGRPADAAYLLLAILVAGLLTIANGSLAEPLTLAPLFAIPAGVVALRFGYSGAAVSGAAAAALALLAQPHQPGSLFFNVLALSAALAIVVAMFAAHIGLHTRVTAIESGIDASTGLAGRRAMIGAVAMELARCERYSRPLSVLLLGLDAPKRPGHSDMGWFARQVGWLMEEDLRDVDVVGSFGDTTLIVVLPETPRENGVLVAERLRSLVSRQMLTAGKGTNAEQVTVSVGVASYPEDSSSAEGVLHAAEDALFAAQAAGGNTVQVPRKLQLMTGGQTVQDG